ncbi:MAG TPA: hypothetical protein VEK11_03270 [Thermoanaerobaculia bacterium]|nr:hypothetical protein [Thermoanaerobaculia bacterium]
MSAFLAAVLSFPTVVFTVLLGLFLLYAIAALIGALDFHALDGILGIHDASTGALEGVLHAFGVTGVPLTLFAGAVSLVGWTTAYLGDRFLPDSTPVDTGIFVGASVLGLVLGSRIVRPLRHAFVDAEGPHNRQLVGKICTIRSLRVSDNAGTAEVGDVVAEVRCFRENDLTLGSKAVVYDYDDQKNLYHVGPIDPTIAT